MALHFVPQLLLLELVAPQPGGCGIIGRLAKALVDLSKRCQAKHIHMSTRTNSSNSLHAEWIFACDLRPNNSKQAGGNIALCSQCAQRVRRSDAINKALPPRDLREQTAAENDISLFNSATTSATPTPLSTNGINCSQQASKTLRLAVWRAYIC
eukprot:3200075-Amphidinium_carterae.1